MMSARPFTVRGSAPALAFLVAFPVAAVVASGLAPSAAGASSALYAVTTRGSSAVTAGEGGRILYSWPAPHNQTWLPALYHDVTTPLRAVTTGANDYFIVGDKGKLLRSTDPEGRGITWIPQASHTSKDLFGIAHAGSRLLVVGDGGIMIRSGDLNGGGWGAVDTANVPTRRRLRSVASLATTVAVGDSGTILWSLTSSLNTWYLATVVPTGADLHGVADGPGNPLARFWAVGAGGVILRSIPSAQEWEALTSPVTVDLHAIAFSPPLPPDNSVIGVAVGNGGTILFSNGGQIWSQIPSGVTADLYGVAFTGSGAGGGFVTVGDENTILWSAFGNAWQEVLVPTEPTSWGRVRGAWRNAGSPR